MAFEAAWGVEGAICVQSEEVFEGAAAGQRWVQLAGIGPLTAARGITIH